MTEGHDHDHHHHHHHTLAPSGEGVVMLNIGPGIGALIINTPEALLGHEIEVSPVADPETRRHAAVRARHVRGGVVWTEVIDNLPEGRYVIWRDPATPIGEVDVPGGGVAEYSWPAAVQLSNT